MSNEAQEWLDELTEKIESEEEYLKSLCPYRPTDHPDMPREASLYGDNVFIGGAVDGMKCPWANIAEQSIEVPTPLTITSDTMDVHRYFRRTVQVGSRAMVFWIYSDLLMRGDDYVLNRIVEWLSSNGIS